MARVATAYVDIKPDLTGFAQELRAKLDAIRVSKEVRIEPNMTGFDDKVRSALTRALSRPTINQDVDRLGGLLGARLGQAMFNTLTPAGDRAGRGYARNFGRGVGRERNFVMRSIGGLIAGIGNVVQLRAITQLGRGIARATIGGGQGLFRAIGNTVQTAFLQAGKLLEKGLAGMADLFLFSTGPMFEIFQKMAQNVSQLFLGMANGASQFFSTVLPGIGQIVMAIGALVFGLIAVQLVLGLIAAIVIPLVAAVIGLIGAVAQLGAVVIASLSAVPGILFAVAAAAGVVFLAWDKLKKVFQDSKLPAALERLRDCIGDIVTAGLGDAFDRLATTVLPRLEKGLGKVAGSVNKMMLDMIAFISECARMDQINRILESSAGFLSEISGFLQSAASGVLTLADVGGPALKDMGRSLATVGKLFEEWANRVAENGQMSKFFADMATAFDRVLNFAVALSGWLGSFMRAALEPASQLLMTLTSIVNSWTLWMDTDKGQEQIKDFLEACNRIVAAFMPVISKVMTEIMELAPAFADFMDVAGPALQDLLDLISDAVQHLMPGFQSFMEDLGELWSDPEFRESLNAFVASIGNLIASLGGNINGGLLKFLLDLQTGINNMVSILMAVFDDIIHFRFDFPKAHEAMDRINNSLTKQQQLAVEAGEKFKVYRDTLEAQLRAAATNKSWDEIKLALETPYDPNNMTLDQWREKVVAALLGVQDESKGAGKKTVDEFVKGMEEQTISKMQAHGAFMVDTISAEVAERHREEYRMIGAQTMTGIVNGATAKATDAMPNVGKTTIGALVGAITGQSTVMYNAGADAMLAAVYGFNSIDPFSAGWRFVQRIKDGMTANQAAYQASHDLAQTMRNFQPDSPAKIGPLSGKGDILLAGVTFSQRLADGMMQGEGDVIRASTALANAAYVTPAYASPSTVGGIDPRSGLTHATIWLGNEQFDAYVHAQIDKDNEDLGRLMLTGRNGV